MKDLWFCIKWIILIMILPTIVSSGLALFICEILGYEVVGGSAFIKIYGVLCLLGYAISLPYYYFKIHKSLPGT